ncbi:hypothetical protein A8709_21000 [Paenibacillus pectinilyticus]|uniref:Glycoside hydrolase n=1 Tax=Paenibacillus pectinilyticus TaxID=512399 RepID=A0A1C0ZXS3_9BACL|nr:glycosyl hydrolase [Paenibacillus pectinilyticus]OCT12820.1 hypothetical protein A8709_21000 [Paenibacillus pectinilyticus]
MKPQMEMPFHNPPSMYRPAPLWVWNDDMDKPRIREQLLALKSQGFGGAFVHPRPGLVTEYLSTAWFELWREALSVAKELEVKLYIYDENSYPSGFAGGHIPAQLPDCLANAVMLRQWGIEEWRKASNDTSAFLNRPGHPIRAYTFTTAPDGKITLTKDITDEPIALWGNHGEHFMVLEIGSPETNSWLGGFAYTDILRPEVTELFLKTTYEAYYARFGDDFGGAIPAIFTDEPEISPGNLFQSGADFLPFSYWLAAEFYKRNGYSLLEGLPALFMDVDGLNLPVDPLKIRYDYYDTLRELWVTNSVKPISQWCESRGIAYTGHYLEHSWPYPWGRSSPSVMSLYEYMHWPAIDMLMTHLLKNDEPESHLMVTIREAHSAANQMSRERVLCEAYGAGGWDSTFEDYKRIGDWLYVHGINFMNQHLTFSTITGARKRDHPQSFDWRQPWWEEYRSLNDYFARLSMVLAQGETHNRVLVLNPTTSAYLQTPEQGSPGLISDHKGAFQADLALFQYLCDEQWDYDFGDEFIIENHGRMQGNELVVGARAYKIVILPSAMVQIRQSTLDLLLQYLQMGGKVLAFNCQLSRIDGVYKEKLMDELRSHDNWVDINDLASLNVALQASLSPRLAWTTTSSEANRGIVHLRRVYKEDDVAYYFITNSRASAQEGVLKIAGSSVQRYDLWEGEMKAIPSTLMGTHIHIPINLAASGSLLLKVDEAVSLGLHGSPEQALHTAWNEVSLTDSNVEVESANIFPIDYCSLVVDGTTYTDISTLYAADKLFEHRGFAANPWDNGIQYKRRLLDRDRFYGESSGFTVVYEFQMDGSACVGLTWLGIEHADWYHVYVNEQLVDQIGTPSTLDHHILEMEITSLLLSGKNVVTLIAHVFQVRMEIEPMYLRGEFGVSAQCGRWLLGNKQEMGWGSWLDYGYPFYNGAVLYSHSFEITQMAEELLITLQRWEGTVVSVYMDGAFVGLIGTDASNSLHVDHSLKSGVHSMQVRVCGSQKNLLGPHHDPDHPRNKAWPGCWKQAPKVGQPRAEQYDLISYGLYGPVQVNYR